VLPLRLAWQLQAGSGAQRGAQLATLGLSA